MSLEKFQATDAWRNKFKNHLFAERKTPIVGRAAAAAAAATACQTPQRLSFELSEELQVILEEKKIPHPTQEMPRVRDVDTEEDKENFKQFHERLHNNTPTKLKRHQNIDATLMDDPNDANVTNTSFETLENMCEKTASDPDSTLFQYLRKGSSSGVQAIRAQRLPSFDEEADALQRLLDELNVEETESDRRMKGEAALSDVTQLDDIEAPSRFWENTITSDTLRLISPVKLVGLMRQSTIMEEYSDVTESEASSTSYQSAMKTGVSSETTECYETANETAACSEQGATKKVSINSSGRSSSSELFQQRHSRQKFFKDDEILEKSMKLIDFGLDENDPLEKSLQLIDLETTVRGVLQDVESLPDSPESPEPAESSKSSPEDDESSLEPLKSSQESTNLTESDGNSSIIELSDDESMACNKKTDPANVLNRSFTIKSESETQDEDEKSLHFNDTMEEVEYMMKKGMQYMQAAKEQPSPAKSHLTPIKKFDRYRSPSPMLSSPLTPKTMISKPKPVNKHALDIKPFPKLDLFKKPPANSMRAPNKLTSSVKKQQQYAHVVSPIGAYIKKTPTTPLMSTIKPNCNESTASSKAFKKMDVDSRSSPGIGSPRINQQSGQACLLPKKAYISSEYKHVSDERTQYTIPGGPKIQRYLLSSMIPAVVRHEGKVKIPTDLRTSDMQPPLPRRTDDSLADLSMISGDVSVYTIKDAQKF